jgi:hypothetical protein
MPAQTTPAETANLVLLEDLEDAGRTSELAESDLDALGAVADSIKTYLVKPRKDVGHPGARESSSGLRLWKPQDTLACSRVDRRRGRGSRCPIAA